MAEASLTSGRLQTFSVGGLRLSAKRWGCPDSTPVLALHGWLDNCASFDFLAPEIAQWDWVCLDGAGHGRSDHRPHLGSYHLWQDVIDLFAVADHLGWRRFNLIGHSRGAMVAFLAAGACPERIGRLSLIEGIIPQPTPSEEAPELLAGAVASLRLCSRRSKRFYSTFEQAVAARLQGTFPVALRDARVLASHGVEQTEQGYTWLYDHKLMASSALRYSQAQLNAFRDRIRAPTQLILAEGGALAGNAPLGQWLQTLAQLQQNHLAGGHHLHMSENAGAVARAVLSHFQD